MPVCFTFNFNTSYHRTSYSFVYGSFSVNQSFPLKLPSSLFPVLSHKYILNMPSQIQHSLSSWCLAVLSLTLFSTSTAQQTKLWINQVPAYSNLPVCAENPVSRIVRGMASGCGDGGALTSFTCFCTDSSSQFASIISTAVESKCGSGDGTNQALDVFASYCRLAVSTTDAAAASTYIYLDNPSCRTSNGQNQIRLMSL